MNQLTFIKKGRLEWQEVEEPKINKSTDAIVRPFIAARCDLDAAFLNYNISGMYRLGSMLGLTDPTIPSFTRKDILKGPFAMGHECIAEIVSMGDGVSGFKKGQKVIIPFQISCGTCPICSSGLTSQCDEYGAFDMYSGIGKHVQRGGTISDLLLVPNAQYMMVPIPDGIDLVSIGSASDNLPDAWSRVAPELLNQAGKKVLIVAGSTKSIGLYAAAFAHKMNAQVDYIDTSEERVEIANKIGVNGIKQSYQNFNGQYDLVVNGTNSKDAVGMSIRCLKPGGVYQGPNIYFNKSVPVPFFQLYAKNLTIKTGLANPMADLPDMLQFIKANKVNLELVNTHIGEWENATTDLFKNTTKVILQRDPVY